MKKLTIDDFNTKATVPHICALVHENVIGEGEAIDTLIGMTQGATRDQVAEFIQATQPEITVWKVGK